jgi:predicted DNA-binding transcriptional regulator YafY
MATNKHATIRYQALDKCFANPGRKYFIDNLVAACNQAIFDYDGNAEGVKKRQVQDDINFMESESGYAIELERIRENRRVYYRYSDPNFSINKQPLNATEEAQLREAILTLSRFKGMPQFEWMDELTVKLESELGLNKTDQKAIEFDQNPYLTGIEHISTLYHAILNKQNIRVAYKSFKSDELQESNFSPHYLKQYNNRWFVLGRLAEFEKSTTYALDRVYSLSESSASYQESSIDYEEHFEDVIGVTVRSEAKIETIVLKVGAGLYPYIKTKPLHGSQKTKEENEEYALIELILYPNYELESVLLSYGENIEVIRPDSLRAKVKERILKASKNY